MAFYGSNGFLLLLFPEPEFLAELSVMDDLVEIGDGLTFVIHPAGMFDNEGLDWSEAVCFTKLYRLDLEFFVVGTINLL